MKKLFLLLALCILHYARPEAATLTAASDSVLWSGRTAVTADGGVRFNFPGVTARLVFTGDSLVMATTPGSGNWLVEVDNYPPGKVCYTPADSVITLATGMGEGPHAARITYIIEGYEHHPEVRSFTAGGFLDAPRREKLKIEFIGNSITCGYGTEGNGPDDHFSYDTENHAFSFAHLTGRLLEADVNVVARSGIGVYRNYNGPRKGNSEGTMPQEYEHTMLYVDSVPWDFSRFRPDIICINLGTNDLSTSNYDLALYEKAMGRFVDRVRELNPGARIVLLTGSMMTGETLYDARHALNEVALKRPGVMRFDMTPEDGSLGYGSDYHPSFRRSIVMARELSDFLRSIR